MESYHQTDDPVKSRLLTQIDLHREEVKGEMKIISKRTEKIIKTALIVGGSLALTYFLISELSTKRKRKKKKALQAEAGIQPHEAEQEHSGPSLIASIGMTLANQALLAVLDIAKEKLMNYLAAQNQPAEKDGDS